MRSVSTERIAARCRPSEMYDGELAATAAGVSLPPAMKSGTPKGMPALGTGAVFRAGVGALPGPVKAFFSSDLAAKGLTVLAIFLGPFGELRTSDSRET